MQAKGYNKVYTGGLSSFSIVLMSAAHLKAEAIALQPEKGLGEAAPLDFGRLLLAFFHRYGNFKCSVQAVSMRKVCRLKLYT